MTRTKPTTEMTYTELHLEADAIARRIVTGAATTDDSVVVIELSNRLMRLQPAKVRVDAAPADPADLVAWKCYCCHGRGYWLASDDGPRISCDACKGSGSIDRSAA